MHRRAAFVAALLASPLGLSAAIAAAQQAPPPPPAPASVLGFAPGADRKLVEWPVLVEYYQQLARASDRVEYRELGKTTLGAPFVSLIVSSARNMAQLDEIRAMNGKLADPRTLGSDQERARLLGDAKAIVLITSSIHSTEVGTHLAPAIIAHRLAGTTEPDLLEVLDKTVLLLVPSLNPDGITIVAGWYNQTLGTSSEGTTPPELYHHYVGHDNNRDWYAFTQVETQLTIDSMHNAWHPQIVHDIHQQGSTGSRFFLPPFMDPVEPNVDPLIVQGFNSLGTYMAWELAGQGKKGIVVNSTYDAWTPARAYQHYHAGVRILSETASARLATPIDLELSDINTGGRGFNPRESSWNYADPWLGGRWGMANILDYQVSGALALLKHAATNRKLWLHNFLKIGERAVKGWEEWPYAFVIPAVDRDTPGLNTVLGILVRGDVEVRTALSEFTAGGRRFAPGTYVVPLRQPYGSFAKALLERQDYPDLRQYPGGPPRAPYDVTAHTLPLLMGIEAYAVTDSLTVPLSEPVSSGEPEYAYAGLSEKGGGGTAARAPRVGLYRSYTGAMDEGWTRWILDAWRVPHRSLVDSDIRGGDLKSKLDVIVIPDASESAIRDGLSADSYPAEYAGGLGDRGVAALTEFVRGGGTLVALNNAAHFAIGAFDLPIRNTVEGFDNQEFYAPGSIFRLMLDTTHAIARGLPSRSVAWYQRGPVFEVTDPSAARVVGSYPEDPSTILLSGWVLNPERIAGGGALVEAPVGRGRVVLFGFRPQYRGQSIATFPLLFNALLLGHEPRTD